jgi:hypothetical protein
VPDPPMKELKPLPYNLKYKFLCPADSLPIIIAFDLIMLKRRNCWIF